MEMMNSKMNNGAEAYDSLQTLPGRLSGTVRIPSSKAEGHRALISAGLSEMPTVLYGISRQSSADLMATSNALVALGASVSDVAGGVLVSPRGTVDGTTAVHCGESGSTLRFLLPVLAVQADGRKYVLDGDGRLPERPVGELLETLRSHGADITGDKLPLTVGGGLHADEYLLPGNVTSQYITGLMFALPLLEGVSTIRLTTELESAGYVEMTLAMLRQFGIEWERIDGGWRIEGKKRYATPESLVIGGDWSNGAAWLVAGALNGEVMVEGLDVKSTQGDRAIVKVLRKFGAEVSCEASGVRVSRAALSACTVDMHDIPDLLPVLAILATAAEGMTHFVRAGRLRLKESDRLAGMAAMICALGGVAKETSDGLDVVGTNGLEGGEADCLNDHRLVMAAALAGLISRKPCMVCGASAVKKSYPTFWEDYRSLGGVVRACSTSASKAIL